jgi:hypothetical protein
LELKSVNFRNCLQGCNVQKKKKKKEKTYLSDDHQDAPEDKHTAHFKVRLVFHVSACSFGQHQRCLTLRNEDSYRIDHRLTRETVRTRIFSPAFLGAARAV